MNIDTTTLEVAKRILDRKNPSASDANSAASELIGIWKLATNLNSDGQCPKQTYSNIAIYYAAEELLMGIAIGRDPEEAFSAARAVLDKEQP